MENKFRVIEDSNGKFRVQEKCFFIWWTLKRYLTPHVSMDATFDTLEEAQIALEQQVKNRLYKKVFKIHKIGVYHHDKY